MILHVIGDAINNIGVIISAVVIWKAPGEGRYYADPAVSTFIALMILATAIPLLRNCGQILLQSAPIGVNLDDVRHDLEKVRPLPHLPPLPLSQVTLTNPKPRSPESNHSTNFTFGVSTSAKPSLLSTSLCPIRAYPTSSRQPSILTSASTRTAFIRPRCSPSWRYDPVRRRRRMEQLWRRPQQGQMPSRPPRLGSGW